MLREIGLNTNADGSINGQAFKVKELVLLLSFNVDIVVYLFKGTYIIIVFLYWYYCLLIYEIINTDHLRGAHALFGVGDDAELHRPPRALQDQSGRADRRVGVLDV